MHRLVQDPSAGLRLGPRLGPRLGRGNLEGNLRQTKGCFSHPDLTHDCMQNRLILPLPNPCSFLSSISYLFDPSVSNCLITKAATFVPANIASSIEVVNVSKEPVCQNEFDRLIGGKAVRA